MWSFGGGFDVSKDQQGDQGRKAESGRKCAARGDEGTRPCRDVEITGRSLMGCWLLF